MTSKVRWKGGGGVIVLEKMVVEVVVVMLVVAKGGVVKVGRGNVSENGSAICREG